MSIVLIALFFLLNALLMPLVVELVKERAPGLALRVIRLAVRLLPRAHRDRYREEWTAELDEMERQNVSQLVSSLRILLDAPSMGWVLRVRDRRQLLVEGWREWLVGGVNVVRTIFITLLTGGLAYLITNLSDQPQIWVLTVTVLISGITLVVQILNDIEYRLGNLENKLDDAIAQLARNFTQVRPDSYDGEERDWLLGLTMQSRHTIDAISLSTVYADGEDFDGGLWISDLGQRHLALQRDAMRREVVIRRVFVIDQPGQTSQDNLLRICRQQKDLGIHVKVLDQSAMPDAIKSPMFDFLVFDSVISTKYRQRHTT